MNSVIDLYQVSLKLLLKNKKGDILILKTLPKQDRTIMYDIPGGRIDEDEFSVPFEQIIRRELIEEVGDEIAFNINPRPVALGRKKFEGVSILFVFFEGTYISGDIKICKEYSGFDWVDPKNQEYIDQFISGIGETWRSYFS